MEDKMAYRIEVLNPPPAMTTTATIVEGTYEEAKAASRDLWRAARRSVTLYSETGMYWWYRIESDGKATDRNTCGGEEAKTEQLQQLRKPDHSSTGE
jgi:hypothetical protein